MTTGQSPKKRETEEQAARRISRLHIDEAADKKPPKDKLRPIRISSSGKVVR